MLKETYQNVEFVLNKIKYLAFGWKICGDLKILSLILGQQSGFTKNPCFLCLWDSRDRKNHYTQKEWPTRISFQPGLKNIKQTPLVNPDSVLLPPLHIKLGLMKQFVKALNKEGKCFEYLQEKFPNILDAKLNEGVFDGPQIRKMLNDQNFIKVMNNKEKATWTSFKNVMENFLGNHKSENLKKIIADLVKNFGKLGCLMNLKLHFLDSHIDYFPINLEDYSEEEGERFHQDIQVMERRYHGRWDVNMLTDYCWTLQREDAEKGVKRKRNPFHRSFENKRTKYHKER